MRVKCNDKAQPGVLMWMRVCVRVTAAGSFQARDNIANFIKWARALGIDQSVLFETEDLVRWP